MSSEDSAHSARKNEVISRAKYKRPERHIDQKGLDVTVKMDEILVPAHSGQKWIWVKNNPKPLPRPRFSRRHGRVFPDPNIIREKDRIGWAYLQGMKKLGLPSMHPAGPIMVQLDFVYKTPSKMAKKLMGEWRSCVPDIDNLAKLVLDALNGVAWGDDSQIAVMSMTKSYGPEGGTRILITPLGSRRSGVSL